MSSSPCFVVVFLHSPLFIIQVIDSVRRDFAHKRRERCVKLDPSSTPGAASRGGQREHVLELIKATDRSGFEHGDADTQVASAIAATCSHHLAMPPPFLHRHAGDEHAGGVDPGGHHAHL